MKANAQKSNLPASLELVIFSHYQCVPGCSRCFGAVWKPLAPNLPLECKEHTRLVMDNHMLLVSKISENGFVHVMEITEKEHGYIVRKIYTLLFLMDKTQVPLNWGLSRLLWIGRLEHGSDFFRMPSDVIRLIIQYCKQLLSVQLRLVCQASNV